MSKTKTLTVTIERDTDGLKRRREATLMEKFREHYHGNAVPQEIVQYSKVCSAVFMWFMAINVLYTSSKYTIPYYFGEVWGLDAMGLYWCKVVLVWIFIQVMSNWLCTRVYESCYRQTDDRPELVKTLWDSHPLEVAKKDDDALLHGRRDQRLLPWKRCHVCQMDQPPRAHHCKPCGKCILKRDHHCFLVGTCVGHYNQRYFVVLNFYTGLISYLALVVTHMYMKDHFWPKVGYMDYFLPYTLYQWAIGGVYGHEFVLMMCHYYTFVWLAPMCTSFFALQMIIIPLGKTMHEFMYQQRIRVMSTTKENYRSVFGDFWPVNFIFPAIILFRQPTDGTEWNVFRTGPQKKASDTDKTVVG